SLSLTLTIPRPSRSTLFPSRRSSDLSDTFIAGEAFACYHRLVKGRASFYYDPVNWDSLAGSDHKHVVNSDVLDRNLDLATVSERSEEHTSELQSRFDLVCRLRLEKKH